MTKLLKSLLMVAPVVLLVACNGSPLISGRQAPDELSVIEGPPLYLPPNYTLRPPQQAKADQGDMSAQRAEELLYGGSNQAQNISGQDEWLLEQAGAEDANPNIREVLKTEAPIENDQTVMEKLMSNVSN